MRLKSKFDDAIASYANWLIRWRWAIIAATLAFAGLCASGMRFLKFATDNRIYFNKDDPRRIAMESLENIYTKNDNVLFVIAPEEEKVFTAPVLHAVEDLTRKAWKIPYAIRVEAITNFQATRAKGDDLFVNDLVSDALHRSAQELEEAKQIALAEPLLRNRLITDKANVTGVLVTLNLPKKEITEVPTAVAAVRQLADEIRRDHPGIKIYLTGMVMMRNAFSETSQQDLQTLVPLMYLIIIVVTALMLRSAWGTIATTIIVILSTVTAMGIAGWLGMRLNPTSAQAPTILMTVGVADSIHVLLYLLERMRKGANKREAIVESLRHNIQPVFLVTLTSVIGFLSLNFSDSQPFRELGNLVAVGITAVYLYSIAFLPALVAVLPVHAKVRAHNEKTFTEHLADLVIRRRRPLLWSSALATLALGVLISRNELNDQFIKYFDQSIQFRTDTEFAIENLTGLYQIEYSLGAGESGGISNPAYLAKLEEFAEWYRQQPKVVAVGTFSDVMKRLNKTMHGDDSSFYRVPDDRELAAQYLLLYELSLPFGLDLNNQINVDKSATKFAVTLKDVTSSELREIETKSREWLRANAPASMFAYGSGTTIIFAYLSQRNLDSMIVGEVLGMLLIAVTLMISMRSIKFGLLSLVPNVLPAILAFGIWGIFVGEIGLGLSVVISMTLGIIVDDTVHFLSKYVRARREKGLSPENAIRYSYASVSRAMLFVSAILIAGFLVLTKSSFLPNSGMGAFTAMTLFLALVADLFFFPPLLLAMEERGRLMKVGRGAFRHAKLTGTSKLPALEKATTNVL